jgi:hypothetical protein
VGVAEICNLVLPDLTSAASPLAGCCVLAAASPKFVTEHDGGFLLRDKCETSSFVSKFGLRGSYAFFPPNYDPVSQGLLSWLEKRTLKQVQAATTGLRIMSDKSSGPRENVADRIHTASSESSSETWRGGREMCCQGVLICGRTKLPIS